MDTKQIIRSLGFLPEENTKDVFIKSYKNHQNYTIKIHHQKGEIDYGNKITLGDKTTSNFKANENFVVLECVNRLLEKGYPPQHITLEKDYPLGHKTKGKLDILVTDKDGKSFLMVECKTWGAEYDKATKKTLSDGGQLLSYFQQDKSAKFLCLYTSRFENKTTESKNGIIKVEDNFSEATNTKEVFEAWNKNLKDNGIFEEWATPYNISIKAITKGSLKPLTKEDSGRIFNQFAEILRHNVVSDKPNAFNKLITLLLCKIVDEDKGDNDELHFQWLENDTNIEMQKRLNDLYKVGMDKYLNKTVTDYSDQDIDTQFYTLNESQRDQIKQIMTQLRLKKNNEFAFKEVFNDSSFDENSRVLKEVVELLQPYQVRYNKKQQFLGDFFELLLNTSIKQEAGQFFTPVPIARFIISSIPIRKIILDKIKNGDPDFLPYVIDYAVGSGHFLTEAMDEIHTAIVEFNNTKEFKPSVKKNLNSWLYDKAFDWAYDFVYGIEKDYRLVKTAKVSCFLNGDGLARIFNADGLGSFQSDKDYQDKLKITSKTDIKDNQQFDILVANPPYSVSAFKNTLVNGAQSFELYNRLTDDSSEIECLFIERTKQLLKEGGYAGIILPSSILSNSGIYSDARDILLKYFKIIAIAEFGSNTFMATGTNTVTLFLQRRNNSDWQKVQYTINNFFINPSDVTCNGIETPFSKYVAHVYKTISFDDYASFINKKPNQKMKENEVYKDYHNEFLNSTFIKNLAKKPAFKAKTETEKQAELDRLFYLDVFNKEKEKLLFFILAYPQKTLLIKANPDGKNETEKEFLGYEFSNRRGHEGIRPYGAKTIQEATKLYDENNLLNPEKINSYIQSSFIQEEINIPENLQKHITQQNLVDMINFDRTDFQKSITLFVKKKVEIEIKSRWELVEIGKICQTGSGGTPLSNISEYYHNGNIPWINSGEVRNGFINSTENFITKIGLENSSAKLFPAKTVLVAMYGATAGQVGILNFEASTNQAICGILPNDKINPNFLCYYLRTQLSNLLDMRSGVARLNLSQDKIRKFIIPLPPKNIQEKIVKEIEAIEKKENEKKEDIKNLRLKEQEEADFLYKKYEKVKLGSVCEPPQYGANESAMKGNPEKDYRYIRITDIDENGELLNNWKTAANVEEQYILKEGDFLFARSGATVGKTFLFKKESPKAIYAGYLIRFRTKGEQLLPEFLNLIIHSTKYKDWVNTYQRKSAQPNINGQEYSSFEIPLPPIKDQQKIVSKIEKIETEITTLRQQLETIAEEKQAVLKKYL